MRKVAFALTVVLTANSATNGATTPQNSLSADLPKEVASCAGSFHAASRFDSYIGGLSSAREITDETLKKFLPAIGVSNTRAFAAVTNAARDQFDHELIAAPRFARDAIRAKIKQCSFYVAQAQDFLSSVSKRAAAEAEKRQRERQAQLQAQKDAEQRKLEAERQVELEKARVQADAEQRQREEIQKREEAERQASLAHIAEMKARADAEKNKEQAAKAARVEKPRIENVSVKPSSKTEDRYHSECNSSDYRLSLTDLFLKSTSPTEVSIEAEGKYVCADGIISGRSEDKSQVMLEIEDGLLICIQSNKENRLSAAKATRELYYVRGSFKDVRNGSVILTDCSIEHY